MRVCIGVVGGSGGAGASTFAAVLALTATATLVDLDELGGGLDVLLGVENVAGARWSRVRLDGGQVEPDVLRDGLPRWRGVPVLAADRSPPAAGVPAVLAAAVRLGPVVVDLPRASTPPRAAALPACDLVVVIVTARIAALTAARAVLAGLPAVPLGVLLRAGDVPAADAAAVLARPVLGTLPPAARPLSLAARRPPRLLTRAASGVLDGLRAAAADSAAFDSAAFDSAAAGAADGSGDGEVLVDGWVW